MLINDLIALLMQVPPVLAAQWGGWFLAGLVLSIWSRRERARLVVHGSTKPKSGVRPPSERAPAKQVKSVPLSSGDAFAELEQLLDEKPSGMHRRPGDDSPVLSEVARPLAAPQSLP
jgi:hypothetical protein